MQQKKALRANGLDPSEIEIFRPNEMAQRFISPKHIAKISGRTKQNSLDLIFGND
jgi:hypothetical protein